MKKNLILLSALLLLLPTAALSKVGRGCHGGHGSHGCHGGHGSIRTFDRYLNTSSFIDLDDCCLDQNV